MNGLHRLTTWCLFGAGAAILLMTVLGAADVIGTALFRQPIPGVYEATEMLMVLVIFLALAFLQTSDGNISVDILTSRFSRRWRKRQRVAAELLALAFFGLLAWQGWLLAMDSWSIGEYAAGLVQFPLYPAKFALAIGAALTALCCIVRLFKFHSLGDAPAGKPPPVE